MYFNIKCIGKLKGPTNEFERSLVFETGEFERPKFDCNVKIKPLTRPQSLLIHSRHVCVLQSEVGFGFEFITVLS